jgi:uncharacterized cupin superfamily protein
MTIRHIKQTRDHEALDDLGKVGTPLSEPACTLRGKKIELDGTENLSTGIWECSPGQFRREVKRGEVMHILSGKCTFTPDGGEVMHIDAGDTLFMSPMTQGVWDIQETVRKVYTLV